MTAGEALNPPSPGVRRPPEVGAEARLGLATALGGFAVSLAGSAGGLLVQRSTGAVIASGLPQAATVVGTGVCAVLISMAAVRGNRRTAVRAAYGTAALGCLAVTVAAPISGSVVGVLAGSAMLGAGQAGVNLSRYWAPGSVPEHQALAIGRVMTWTTLGAIAGTSLLGPLDAVWSAFLPPLVGSYASALLALVAAWCVLPTSRERARLTPRTTALRARLSAPC